MPNPAPVAYPLGAPTISNNQLTVDTALKQPGRITRRIADLTLQKFIVDKIFASSGASVASGAVLFDQLTANELYLSRDVEERAPATEYPVITSERSEPKVAKSEDWGGKFWVSDEAVKRNDKVHFDNQVTQLANTIVRKVNSRAVATLEAAITAVGGAAVVPGHDWTDVTLTGNSPTPNNERPFADFSAVQLVADKEELGVVYDLWIVNPDEQTALDVAYEGRHLEILRNKGIELFASNRVAPGTAYAVATRQVGFLDYEEGLSSESWREQKTRRNWVQSWVKPIMGITNPYSIKKVTGLAG